MRRWPSGFVLFPAVSSPAVLSLAVLSLAVLSLAGCRSGDPATTDSATSSSTSVSVETFAASIETVTGTVSVDALPVSIVSISPTSTEVLFAIGAGDQVVAVDDQSTYPSAAPTTDLTGFSSSAEAIAAYEPDLVFLSFDPGDLVPGLAALGIPTVVHGAAASVAEALQQIEQVGAITGHSAEAKTLVADIDSQISDLSARFDGGEPLSYYHELDNTLYSLTSSTFVGELYGILGLVNIADPADNDGFGYPQLSEEFIVEQDPDLIFLADTKCCSQTAETVAARPGWDQLSAVQSGRVIELDDDVASRWGPRISELLDQVADAVGE